MNRRTLFACALLLPACGDGAEVQPVEPEPVLERSLAEVELGQGRSLVITEAEPGIVTVYESGPVSAPPALYATSATSLVELYRQLVDEPDPNMSNVLAEADDRIAVRRRQETDATDAIDPTVAEATSEPAKPDDTSTVSQALSDQGPHAPPTLSAADFRATYCNQVSGGFDGGFCQTNTTAGDSGWPGDLSWIRSTVLHGGSGGPVAHNLRRWVCVSSFAGICFDRDWRTRATQSIPAGHYGIFVDTAAKVRFSSSGPVHHFGGVWNRR